MSSIKKDFHREMSIQRRNTLRMWASSPNLGFQSYGEAVAAVHWVVEKFDWVALVQIYFMIAEEVGRHEMSLELARQETSTAAMVDWKSWTGIKALRGKQEKPILGAGGERLAENTPLIAQTVKYLSMMQETPVWSRVGKIPWRRKW